MNSAGAREGSRALTTASLSEDVRGVADRTSSPIALLDSSGHIRYANPAAGSLVGRSASWLVGRNVLDLVHPSDRDRVGQDLDEVVAGRMREDAVEYRIRSTDGHWKTISAVASNLLDLPSASGILVSATDVTQQRQQEQALRGVALRDPITGLPNRLALREHLQAEMAYDEPIAVAFINLDHFKQINDCLGHTVGDAVLQAVALRLDALMPANGMIAHFGADSFVAVLIGTGPQRALNFAWAFVARLSNPLFIAGHELRLGASVGIAMRDNLASPESILRDADAALSHAKATRRGGVEVFTNECRIRAVERLELETDLRHAVENQQLALRLQPVVRLATGQAEGSEALLRWDRPKSGETPPEIFVAVAEETGLISAIGDWALAAAIGAVANGRTPRVSVNLSPRQLLDPGLPARVERYLASHRLRPDLVAFEVTETVIIENFPLASASLSRLRQLGCAVGLDDFGTGYSSLGYLRRMPLDFLKLDRSLVADIDTDPQANKIAQTIIELAGALSLTTIAEGVERQPQADALKAMGCHYGQGWLYGRPEPL